MTAPAILVRGPNWLGDLAMSTPGFRALRAGFPDARIVLHVRTGLEALLAGSPWFDEVLPVRSYRAGALAMAREGRALRDYGRFDLGVCIPDSWSSALLLRAAGVREIVGYAGRGRGLLLQRAVSAPEEWGRRRMVSRERFVLGLTAALGCEDRGTHLELFTTEAEEARAATVLAERDLGGAAPLVVLVPGASYGPSKLWPIASFAEVGDAVVRSGARVLVLGTAAEASLVDAVVDAMGAPAAGIAGALDLGALKAVIRKARVVVCNDAGARHVAVAFGVPCIVLMGPTSLEKTSANLETVRVLEAQVDCRPCYQRVCPIDHRCMTRLLPADVTREVLSVLHAPSAGPVGPSARRAAEKAES